ncbi:SpoIIE family protein phosphatase [Microcoleus sp. FACHB-1515]|uniref:PP2C family protein-serine/threonine phosphatase n=1 Tax=Cyanophyceae TaxID=3028117 RepID=UPI001682DDB3|nr:SpoIIE family protein phosphatase [Microcoleus sp. FACHB-1515]MBD2089149.1 SpoIIE family protein phosphatase [Microcoleus sp. FACHB-1515]
MPHILVIDDDPIARMVLERALASQGYEVSIADSGQAGLEQARRCKPALIVCDWVMPGMSGLEVCRQVKADPSLATTFFIMLTARGSVEDRIEGLDTGADDFLARPIEISELQARVRSGLRLHQLTQDLDRQKQLLEAEFAEAAIYVRSLLPNPLRDGVAIDTRFLPSQRLGGDCFDYFWLDPDYLAVYLLDVSGHGLGAALLSVTVLNLLRSQGLPDVNFYQPHDVLRALNETFPMHCQNDKYFTIWYGVYNRVQRQLTYASAGHPPAILVNRSARSAVQLRTPALPIGMIPDAQFSSDRCTVPPNSSLYIFSDGVYEVTTSTGWGLEPFVDLLTQQPETADLDDLLRQIQRLNQVDTFADDLSILHIVFDPISAHQAPIAATNAARSGNSSNT